MSGMNSLKAAVGGLTTYQNFLNAGMSLEQAREAAKRSNQHITPSAFASLQDPKHEGKYAELVALAESLGIVGVSKAKRSSNSGGSGKGSTNFALLKSQHPEVANVIQSALDAIASAKGGFPVTLEDGKSDVVSVQVAFKRAGAPKRADKQEASTSVV